MNTIRYYASMKAQGRTLPAAIDGVEDDPLQMGGDFTFRCAAKFIFNEKKLLLWCITINYILHHLVK